MDNTKKSALIKALYLAIPNFIYHENNKAKVEAYFISKGFISTRGMRIFTLDSPLESISDVELYMTTKLIYEDTHVDIKDVKFNPKTSFSDTEIKSANEYKYERAKDEVVDRIEFKNVIKVSDNQYVCVISIQQLVKGLSNSQIVYNTNTQRQTTKTINEGTVYESPTLNEHKIKGIKNTILNKKPFNNRLSLNIRRTDSPDFEWGYNSKTKSLWVKTQGESSTVIDIIDGGHRATGASKALRDNKDLDYSFVIDLFSWEQSDAQAYIYNVNLQTPLHKAQVQAYNQSNVYMTMAQEINRYGNSDNNYLFGKLGVELIETNGNKYTTLEIFSKSIEENFGKLKGFEITKVKNYLLEGFMYIIGSYEQEFKNKKLFVCAEPLMFTGYIAILSELYKNPNWNSELLEKLKKFDFRKTNDEWKEIEIFNTTITIINRKKISDYFKSK